MAELPTRLPACPWCGPHETHLFACEIWREDDSSLCPCGPTLALRMHNEEIVEEDPDAGPGHD